MQAWGNYGTMWAAVGQQLGVRPFLPYGTLAVVPQVPQGQPSVAGSNIRVGSGSVDVFASHLGTRYVTKLQVHGIHLRSLQIGTTLPSGSAVRTIVVDGHRARHVSVRDTNRGVEVSVPVSGNGLHTLIVTSG
jgi:hypothetical protein